jgi:hypothetical protein
MFIVVSDYVPSNRKKKEERQAGKKYQAQLVLFHPGQMSVTTHVSLAISSLLG